MLISLWLLVIVFSTLKERKSKVDKNLYVGGLSYGTTEASLRSLFARIGTVDSVQIMTDRENGRSKGFGFVEMNSVSEALQAVTLLDGTFFEGRNITVICRIDVHSLVKV
jgi:RNA recognition motif-containing protein